jgi:arylsulfatase
MRFFSGLDGQGSRASAALALAAVAIVLFGLYAYCSLELPHGVDLMRVSRSGLASRRTSPAAYSGIFDLDVMRVVREWTGDTTHPTLEAQRTHVHPLSRLALTPFVSAIHGWVGGRALDLARIVAAFSLALNALLTGWLAYQLAGGSLVPALLAAFVYGVSFCSMLLGTIPDSASVSCLSTTVPLVYLNRRLDHRFQWREALTWGFLGLFCFAFTLSQIMHWFIALGLRLFWLLRGRDPAAGKQPVWALGARILVLFAVFGSLTWAALALQHRVYPRTHFSPQNLSVEGNFLRTEDLANRPVAHTARLAAHFFGYNFTAPFPGYSDYLIRRWHMQYWSLSLEEVHASDLNLLQRTVAAMLLSLFVLGAISLRQSDRRFLAPLLCIAGQFVLHLAYGREYILYSPNWHGPLVAVVIAACWNGFESKRKSLTLFVLALSGGMLVNNVAVLNRVYAEVDVGLEQWHRDASGRPLAVREPGEEILPSRRHILLLTVDTLRPDYMSRNGFPLPTTPFVDSMLSSGYVFSNAVTPEPRTTPALASLLTGSYPHTHKIRTLFESLTPGVTTLAEILRAQDYSTVAVVSNLVLGRKRGLDRGFQVYDHGMDARDAARTTNQVLARLKLRKRDSAIFLWVHYFDPHMPYFPPRNLAQEFDPGYRGPYPWNFGQFVMGVNAFPKELGKARAVFKNDLPERVNEHIRRLYAADIRHTDDQIARLMGWLRNRFGDDWLVFFAADHGESLGEHDYYFDHGDYVYNATVKIPFGIVFPPGDPLRGSNTFDSWASLVDVVPTVADLLGLQLSANVQQQLEGRSLVPGIRGDELPARPVFSECGKSFFPDHMRRRVHFDVAGRFRAVMLGDWKLIWTPGQNPDSEFELYRIDEDPQETVDRYRPDHPEVAALRKELQAWLRSDTDRTAPLTSGDRETLRALGYLE